MYLIVGLGNPERKYNETRHNIGFNMLDFVVDRLALDKFKLNPKFKSEMTMGDWDGKRIILAKPQTYMNSSGVAVQLLKNYYKIQSENIIVIYDELDLPFGEMRVRYDGSSAGHNGIKSIIEYLATDQFIRVRIGIRNKEAQRMEADKFVLAKFSFFEKRKLKSNILPHMMDELFKLISK